MSFARLEVDQSTYDDIAARLREAGYGHLFLRDGGIGMTGIAIEPQTGVRPRDCDHQDGCDYTHAPVWICGCSRTPRPVPTA